MFAHNEIASQPVFYLFIAFTILLTLGFTWGRRRNGRILHGVFDAISAVLKPRDQQFTNIGGQTGYHANFIPGAARSVRRVDATLTLLPRQSWLYLPFSLLIQKFDRLFLVFFMNKRGRKVLKEGHLIEKRFEKLRGNTISNASDLITEEFEWGGMTFRIYAADEEVKRWMEELKNRLEVPGAFRHAALVPSEESAYLFQIPKVTEVARTTGIYRDWLDALAETGKTDSPTESAEAGDEDPESER